MKSRDPIPSLIVLLLGVGVAATTIGLILYRKKKKSEKNRKDTEDNLTRPIEDRKAAQLEFRPNSICLFGDFEVRDRKNRDITYMFSAQRKQILCLLLQYSENEGISSQHLSEIIWPEKPVDKVKNSRGVALNHLRKIFEELEGIELTYEKGLYKLMITDDLHCDYIQCIELIRSKNLSENRNQLITILERGKFLKHADELIFDNIKESLEKELLPILLLEINNCFIENAFQDTLSISNILFQIDPTNDIALAFQLKAMKKLDLDEEAQIRYRNFIVEYRKTMGSNYPNSFKDIVQP